MEEEEEGGGGGRCVERLVAVAESASSLNASLCVLSAVCVFAFLGSIAAVPRRGLSV